MNKDTFRPCARCGIPRRGRATTLCPDCCYTISKEEKALWQSQIAAEREHMRKLAA